MNELTELPSWTKIIKARDGSIGVNLKGSRNIDELRDGLFKLIDSLDQLGHL